MSLTNVAIIMFDRADLVSRVLDRVIESHPPKLYLIGDGPKNTEESKTRVEQARHAAYTKTKSLYDTDVTYIYSDTNLNIGNNLPDGVTKAFETCDRLIILEDDLLPDLTFFQFMDTMFKYYADDPRVWAFSGRTYYSFIIPFGQSYMFRVLGWLNGWGITKENWSKYDKHLKLWGDEKYQQRCKERFSTDEWNAFHSAIDRTYKGEIITWDYQALVYGTIYGQWTITSCCNLVQDMGHRYDGTYTRNPNSFEARTPVASMNFPLVHPKETPDIYKFKEEYD